MEGSPNQGTQMRLCDVLHGRAMIIADYATDLCVTISDTVMVIWSKDRHERYECVEIKALTDFGNDKTLREIRKIAEKYLEEFVNGI